MALTGKIFDYQVVPWLFLTDHLFAKGHRINFSTILRLVHALSTFF